MSLHTSVPAASPFPRSATLGAWRTATPRLFLSCGDMTRPRAAEPVHILGAVRKGFERPSPKASFLVFREYTASCGIITLMAKREIHIESRLVYVAAFCTKYRRPVLVGKVEERFRETALEAAREIGFEIIEIRTAPDHVRVTVELDPRTCPNRAVKGIKAHSSHVLREEFPELKRRLPALWTNNYLVATVGSAAEAEGRMDRFVESQAGA